MSSNFRRSLQLAIDLEDAAKEAKKKDDEEAKKTREGEIDWDAVALRRIAGMKHRIKLLAVLLGLYLIILAAIMLLYSFTDIEKGSALWWSTLGILTVMFWFPSGWIWILRKKEGG